MRIEDNASKYHIYQYQHIDFLGAIMTPEGFTESHPLWGYYKFDIDKFIANLKVEFQKNGWEGDGDIGIIWVPPFIANSDTTGDFIWHVKQYNNGTSFIASEKPLRYSNLLEQNSY